MKYYAFFLFIICFPLAAATAQESQTLFVNKKGVYVSQLDSAEYIRVLNAPDSTSSNSATTLFGVVEYYKNGKTKSIGYCKNPNKIIYHGQYISYYPSGIKKKILNYHYGILINVAYLFYPNGKLYSARSFKFKDKDINFLGVPEITLTSVKDSTGKEMVTNDNGYYIEYSEDFTFIEIEGTLVNKKWEGLVKGSSKNPDFIFDETYKNGKLISGVSTDVAGKKYPYKKEETVPEFKGGDIIFERLLSLKTGALAIKKEIKGKMLISFVIEASGYICEAKIDRGLDPELDLLILQALNLSPKWNPGLVRGIGVRTKYKMPISFDFKEKPAKTPQPIDL